MSSEKRRNILFVDDEGSVLKGLQRMLRRFRNDWEMTFVESGQAALDYLGESPCDVVITDMRMPQMNGRELLSIVREQYPHVVRIVLSGQANIETVIEAVEPTHQYLSKPCDPDVMRATISRACGLRDLLHDDALRSLVTRIDSVPSLPSVYQELHEALSDPETTVSTVGDIISHDGAMTAKVLKMVNSAYFGTTQDVTSGHQAVAMLGVDMVKTLVLSAGVFSQFTAAEMQRFSLAEFEEHSQRVGAIAEAIMLDGGGDKETAACAYTAGLMHDLGKLILMKNCATEYSDVIERSQTENRPLGEVEQQIFGTSHAAIGAYLLGIWGLPDDLIAAVGFHHQPFVSGTEGFCPLSAVHVANAVDHSVEAVFACDRVDEDYLQQIGMAHKLPEWTALAEQISQGAN
ncbi:MAG: response regulator [Planctomycetaceae bacterium]|nr:response regulator [Planctomycetaceae bacterium]